jgi:hypothetical protein
MKRINCGNICCYSVSKTLFVIGSSFLFLASTKEVDYFLKSDIFLVA